MRHWLTQSQEMIVRISGCVRHHIAVQMFEDLLLEAHRYTALPTMPMTVTAAPRYSGAPTDRDLGLPVA